MVARHRVGKQYLLSHAEEKKAPPRLNFSKLNVRRRNCSAMLQYRMIGPAN
jgi:hypothetical protein